MKKVKRICFIVFYLLLITLSFNFVITKDNDEKIVKNHSSNDICVTSLLSRSLPDYAYTISRSISNYSYNYN